MGGKLCLAKNEDREKNVASIPTTFEMQKGRRDTIEPSIKAETSLSKKENTFSGTKLEIKNESDKSPSLKLNEETSESWQPQNYRLDNKRKFHNIVHSPYVLPADIEELDRLEIQHVIITHCFGKLFQMPIDKIISKSGAKILDVGCGPGSWTRDVANMYPLCEVHAIDMTKTFFNDIEKLPNTFFAVGNILEGLPYPDNHFDGIPKNMWEIAIKELVRVTKPGGFIECVEGSGSNLEQTGPLTKKLWDAGKTGPSNWNITDNMRNGGISIQAETPTSLPIGWGGKVGDLNLVNLKLIAESLKPFLMQAFEMNGEDFDKMCSKVVEEYPKYKSYLNVISVVGKKV
ncbi:hypothetical protein HK096_008720 [Nowakowskiella sp. JEL0078]|nr:hypothetical protein HK096_008720 [Nowakowskiella sp. JEL0078]